MPGYIMHLACAKRVLEFCKDKDDNWKNQFLIGNIIADTCEKKASHFWDDEMYKRFDRSPNLDMFLDKYETCMKDPYVFGYYAHLYLDHIFVTDYWKRHFAFYDEKKKPEISYENVRWVFLKDTKTWYERERFFSDELYYGDYDRMNQYMKESFDVQIPLLQKPEFEIDEVKWETAEEGLRNMLTKLEELNRKSIETFTPPLNIFILSDLVSMIETAAKEIARRNA